MNLLLAMILPPATALAGLRILSAILGAEFPRKWGFGLRFACGLGVGMLVFTQILLGAVLLGWNIAGPLARAVLLWGGLEFLLLFWHWAGNFGGYKFQKAHGWLLLLLPLVYYFWVFARLSVVEGTTEFDGATHWLIKAKVLYLTRGPEFVSWIQNPNLVYIHWDYPMLVPALYTLNYGAVGGVDDFITKVWPLWMVIALCLAIFSLADAWRNPRPLPLLVILLVCFLPATLYYIRAEGGTIPMVFYLGLTALLIVRLLSTNDPSLLPLCVLLLVGGAMSKFEGIIYAAMWFAVLLPVAWKRQWLKNARLGYAVLLSIVCVSAYVVFRLKDPVLHFESHWPKTFLQSPGAVLAFFPEVLAHSLAGRFFDPEFFQWTVGSDNRLHWAGHWTGRMLVHHELSLLPWLGLFLLGFTYWRKSPGRSLVYLTSIILGCIVVLAFVIACLPHEPGTDADFILSKTREDMNRYCYPGFLAWFLGIVSLWFREEPPTESAAASPPLGSALDSRAVKAETSWTTRRSLTIG